MGASPHLGTTAAPNGGLLKIGEVADQVGLSLRTIRFYEEEGLVVPETRTAGGFRLYSPAAVARLALIRKMKPLGFSIEDMGAVLHALDRLGRPVLDPVERGTVAEAVHRYSARVEAETDDLLTKAEQGRDLARYLRTVAAEAAVGV